ncbi:MAG: hypothetical protein WCI55_10470 [Armatimonadota bacterium]
MERIPLQIKSIEDFELELAKLNCNIAVRSSLKSFPGCVHWHIKHNVENGGTLEFTILPTGECWLSVHRNRHKPWIVDVLKQIA